VQISVASDSDGAELFIGIVGAVGTNLEQVIAALRDALAGMSYQCHEIRLSDLLHTFSRWKNLANSPADDRYREHMTAGTNFRQTVGRGDGLAALALSDVRTTRRNLTGAEDIPAPRVAYILRSLKRPEEASLLRNIYGPSFFLVAAYCPRELRVDQLAQQISDSHHVFDLNKFRATAEELVQRDETETDTNLGQNVRELFPLADVFVNAADPTSLRSEIGRFAELIFGNTFHTPTKDEYCMFHAHAAALRSASLARQVGAVIATSEGDIVAVGTNEVPKPGGGSYWPDDNQDYRDYVLGYDTSDRMRRDVLADILRRLRESGWLSTEKQDCDIDSLISSCLDESEYPIMKGSHLLNVTEFVRAVHAEMAAITDAARRGVAISACSLYTTTFPCHDCAKHIVSSGIVRVIYVEAYPKSLVPRLYPDSIRVDDPSLTSGFVRFESFVGVAPRQYLELFAMSRRKDGHGSVIVFDRTRAVPRQEKSSLSYIAEEKSATAELTSKLVSVGISSSAEEMAPRQEGANGTSEAVVGTTHERRGCSPTVAGVDAGASEERRSAAG
jgi:cytidine deaminase